MKQTLEDFGLYFEKVPMYCDNPNAILSKTLVQHSRARHNELRHHFINDHIGKSDISIVFIGTYDQLANTFTKPLTNTDFALLDGNRVLATTMN